MIAVLRFLGFLALGALVLMGLGILVGRRLRRVGGRQQVTPPSRHLMASCPDVGAVPPTPRHYTGTDSEIAEKVLTEVWGLGPDQPRTLPRDW